MTQPMKHTSTSMMLASASLRRLMCTPTKSAAENRPGPRQSRGPATRSQATETIEAASASAAPGRAQRHANCDAPALRAGTAARVNRKGTAHSSAARSEGKSVSIVSIGRVLGWFSECCTVSNSEALVKCNICSVSF
jgi:hypothetical protein